MISFLPGILGNVLFSEFLVLTCHGFGFFSIFFLDVFTDVAGRKKEFFFCRFVIAGSALPACMRVRGCDSVRGHISACVRVYICVEG
jgi:hypothetical protein